MKDFDLDFDVAFEVDAEDGVGWPEKYRQLSDRYRSRSMLTDPDFPLTVKGLTSDELACCILQATLEGREGLVRAMFQLRGPVAIVYEKGRDEHDIATVNGIEFAISRFDKLKSVETLAEVKSLYKMIQEFGMKGIIEAGETFPLLCEDHIGFFKEDTNKAYDGVLPFLDAGCLKQPELVFALLDESQGSVRPEAYQPVLCWATKEMVKEFPGQLAPLTTFQEVGHYGALAEWKDMVKYQYDMDFQRIVTGVRPSENSTPVADLIFAHMAPASTRLGFDDERGRILCETNISFLLGFETGPSEDATMIAAQQFVAGYFPMDIISAQVTNECIQRFGHDVKPLELSSSMQKIHTTGFSNLFGLLAKDHPLRDRAMSMMPREMWKKLALMDKGNKLSAESLVALHDAFGIDNTGMTLNLWARKGMAFFGTGYRFSDQTEVFDGSGYGDHYSSDHGYSGFFDHEEEEQSQGPTHVYLQYESTDFVSTLAKGNDDIRRQMLEGYMEMIKVNLWPVPGEKPTDLRGALDLSVRENFTRSDNKLVMSLKAYLMLAGVEACSKAATEPAHWERISETFSSDELTPYLHLMPKRAKGRLLENVLGI